MRLEEEEEESVQSWALGAALADAVTAHPASPSLIHRLHAYVARVTRHNSHSYITNIHVCCWDPEPIVMYYVQVQLERARASVKQLRAALWSVSSRHPPAARNATWPGGLRAEPGLSAVPPDTRYFAMPVPALCTESPVSARSCLPYLHRTVKAHTLITVFFLNTIRTILARYVGNITSDVRLFSHLVGQAGF